SGDLAHLAKEARKLLDGAGLTEVKIFASSSLDEYVIESLLARGAPIDGFGVGAHMATSADAPFLDTAYKLVEYAGVARMKHSQDKTTLPGRKQIFRERSGQFDDVVNSLHGVVCVHQQNRVRKTAHKPAESFKLRVKSLNIAVRHRTGRRNAVCFGRQHA